MKIVTHSGNFHADDIFAVATLLLVYQNAEVVRSRDPEVWKIADVLVDVGEEYDPEKKRFDHHQSGGAGKRENGIPYASFGLVWKEFGEKVAGGPEAARIIDDRLVAPIDAHDNGTPLYEPKFENIEPYLVDDFLNAYIDPEITDLTQLDPIFLQAVGIAKSLLNREVKMAKFRVQAMAEVQKVYEYSTDKRLIVLDRAVFWKEILTSKKEPLFVVYPVGQGWYAQAVPVRRHGFENRKTFPSAWAGKTNVDLAQVSGVSDAIFAHNTGFLAVAKTKEGAIKLAQIALEA